MLERPTAATEPDVENLTAMFSPSSVAVIGASPRPDNIGNLILGNILRGGFTGAVYPVHPSARAVRGIRAYKSVLDVPDPVDLAVVAVPAQVVPAVVDECARHDVKALVVISAGFRETGDEGARREARLREQVRGSSMRLVGPNCLGIMNTNPDVALNATFAPRTVPFGPAAMMTQSGALGVAILEHAADLHLGISRFASLGNKTDVSGNDLLELWEDDPDVRVLLMYLESFGNPRKFVPIARRISREKPIIVVKSGRTERGARAASTHTGALAESDKAVDALFEQCGVVRAATIEELFDHALAMSLQPLPRGNRVAIVTNSGGPGILATDALEGTSLALADLHPSTGQRLREVLPPEASLANPVDLIAGAGPEEYREVLGAVLADDGVDAALVIYTPTVATREEEVADAVLATSAEAGDKPVLAVTMGRGTGAPAFTRLVDGGVPVFSYPENAVKSLVAMHRLAQWRARPEGEVPDLRPDVETARRILREAQDSGEAWLSQPDAFALLSAYGIPTPGMRFAHSEEEAAAVADHLGYPVVLKGDAEGLVHKTEEAAIHLGLMNEAEVREAWRDVEKRLTDRDLGFRGCMVMEHVKAAHEVLLGGRQDRKFGPMVLFGLGGIYTEVLSDVVVRLAPLTDMDANRAVRSIRAFPLLEGARGRPHADVAAVEDALVRVARLMADLPEVAEMDVNPLMARERGEGVVAVDVRVRLAPTA